MYLGGMSPALHSKDNNDQTTEDNQKGEDSNQKARIAVRISRRKGTLEPPCDRNIPHI
jgi:hypothetical protein